MEPLLEGRSGIVTGAGRGIGRGIALCLARDGAEVLIADVNDANAKAVTAEIHEMERNAVSLVCDVGSRDGARQLIEAALSAFGKIDILVNNAGVVGAPGWQQRSEPSDEDWAEVLRVNLMSRVFCSEAAAPYMKERGYGKIINIASIGGLQGGETLAHYCASKAADINYTQSLALQLGRHNINVNAILPGLLLTDMMKGIQDRGKLIDPAQGDADDEELFARRVRHIPMKRGQTPEDIGDLAAFLASERARNINGQAIDVDGGYRMH